MIKGKGMFCGSRGNLKVDVKQDPIKETPLETTPKSLKEKEEYGGPKGLEPTRYGDWEVNGRCSDF